MSNIHYIKILSYVFYHLNKSDFDITISVSDLTSLSLGKKTVFNIFLEYLISKLYYTLPCYILNMDNGTLPKSIEKYYKKIHEPFSLRFRLWEFSHKQNYSSDAIKFCNSIICFIGKHQENFFDYKEQSSYSEYFRGYKKTDCTDIIKDIEVYRNIIFHSFIQIYGKNLYSLTRPYICIGENSLTNFLFPPYN